MLLAALFSIYLILPSSVVYADQCDASIKDDLEKLQDAQMATFNACEPGKKIWDAIVNTKAPNFKTCVCSQDVYTNLTSIRKYQALCEPNNLHDLAQTDALIGQWKVSCDGAGVSGSAVPTQNVGDRLGPVRVFAILFVTIGGLAML